ncbi:hypothetical protein [Agilicoccus flavus]|uniref:hypothetical protein n=1 Tax=Agilicoccus flavus TaxID=2775968 RepID=UPI001CF63FCD|nr:hypothetical protein [Agilicoccus flavus]
MTALTSSSTTDVGTDRADPLTSRATLAPTENLSVRGRVERTAARRGPDPVPWIAWLYVLNFLLQRISLPGISIPLTVPITLAWLVFAWRAKVLVIEPRRMSLWVFAAGAAAFMVVPQILWVDQLYISPGSWAFWMVIWVPMCFMFADRSRETFNRALRAITTIGVWIASLSVFFFASQVAGLPYRDYLGEALPSDLLVQDFVISYPIFYDSPLYKSNGWVALEPSFMSFTLGMCIMAGLLTSASVWKIAWMAAGMIVTVGGSGFAIVLAGVVVMVLCRQGRLLRPYLVPAVILGFIAAPTQVGQQIWTRLSEGSSSNSSTALRTFEPYVYLWPRWIEDWPRVLFGGGAGSSHLIVGGSGVRGLVVPTIGKVFYDYGLVVGALLFLVFVVSYVRSPEPALGMTVLASMAIIQPPAQPLMVPAYLLVTLFAPALRGDRPNGTGPQRREPPPGLLKRLRPRRAARRHVPS